MEPGYSLPCSQQLTPCFYPQPCASSLPQTALHIKDPFNIISSYTYSFNLVFSDSLTKTAHICHFYSAWQMAGPFHLPLLDHTNYIIVWNESYEASHYKTYAEQLNSAELYFHFQLWPDVSYFPRLLFPIEYCIRQASSIFSQRPDLVSYSGCFLLAGVLCIYLYGAMLYLFVSSREGVPQATTPWGRRGL